MTVKEDLRDLKRCTNCEKEKRFEDFYSKGNRLESVCKECKKERSRSDYRLKFSDSDKERIKLLVDTVVNFHLQRQCEVASEINDLLAKAITKECA